MGTSSFAGSILYPPGAAQLFSPSERVEKNISSDKKHPQCFLEAGDGFCKLESTKNDLSDLTIHLDRHKILTAGRAAVGEYLQKLHIYKSTADVDTGINFFTDMTSVDPEYWGKKVRQVVLDNKQPRKVFVQPNTYLDKDTGKVTLKHYDATPEGMIQSFAEREASASAV